MFFLNIQLHVRHPILSWIRVRPRWVINTFINIFYHIKIFYTGASLKDPVSTLLEIYKGQILCRYSLKKRFITFEDIHHKKSYCSLKVNVIEYTVNNIFLLIFGASSEWIKFLITQVDFIHNWFLFLFLKLIGLIYKFVF